MHINVQNIWSDFAASNNLKYLRKSDSGSTVIVLQLELISNNSELVEEFFK